MSNHSVVALSGTPITVQEPARDVIASILYISARDIPILMSSTPVKDISTPIPQTSAVDLQTQRCRTFTRGVPTSKSPTTARDITAPRKMSLFPKIPPKDTPGVMSLVDVVIEVRNHRNPVHTMWNLGNLRNFE